MQNEGRWKFRIDITYRVLAEVDKKALMEFCFTDSNWIVVKWTKQLANIKQAYSENTVNERIYNISLKHLDRKMGTTVDILLL